MTRRIFFSLGAIALILGLPLDRSFITPASGASSSAIIIQSDSDFTTCGCIRSGTGAKNDPFIIGPLSISNVNGDSVLIDGTNLTKSFTLLNLSIAGNGATSNHGIVLRHINPKGTQDIVVSVLGVQTSIQSTNIGILIDQSNYVTLDGAGENPNGAGIKNNGAGTINNNVNGAIDVENSSHITIKGWQMSANGTDHAVDWVTLDPGLAFWGVGGVRFFGVTNSTIDHNAANNCTNDSYALFNSSSNVVSNNTADYPFITNFLLTDGSSNNTVSNNVASTGDFLGFLVADPLPGTATLAQFGPAHDNVISGNFSNANGPTGNELHANVVPAFLGGIVVLNGTFNNQILNNQVPTSTGGGLVWAQAVPSSTTPIGVVTYPPTLHCNVTATEGGGGVANLNGNVWKGNTFKIMDTCLPPQ